MKKQNMLYGMLLIACCNSATAWTAGSQCNPNNSMSTYYQCNCDQSYQIEYEIIVGPCDSYEQEWCYDSTGVCAADGGEGACAICNCPDEIPAQWATYSTGKVSRKVNKYSNNSNYYICSETTITQYACAQGYYDSRGVGISTSASGVSCTRCPSSGGVYGTTAGAGADAITDCYLPSGTAFSDTTGGGTYTGNCYYKN